MSRKHYVIIAKEIHDIVKLGREQTSSDLLHFALKMCDHFKKDNPQFNSSRFLKACGFGSI